MPVKAAKSHSVAGPPHGEAGQEPSVERVAHVGEGERSSPGGFTATTSPPTGSTYTRRGTCQGWKLSKLVVQLSAGRLVIAREPAHAAETAEFCTQVGLDYRGASLCASVGSVLEKLLKPKRAAISEKLRNEVSQAQEHRCAICLQEFRTGTDHGDHVGVLRDQVAGQRQRFRLLCATCKYAICDAGQRRDGEILRSHY